MRNLERDLVYGLRRLRSSPGFTVFAVVSLAIGIGASTAIFSLLRAVTGPPPGVRDVSTLINVYHYPGGGLPMRTLSWPDYQEFSRRQTTLDHLTAWDRFSQAVTVQGSSQIVSGEAVGGNYFALLGVNAALGRPLQPADDDPASPNVVVISHGLWQRLFGGAPDVVGQTLKMNGQTFEVVGVAPREFQGLFNNGLVASGVWVPLAKAALIPQTGADFSPINRDRRWVLVKGRLRVGRSLDEVAAEVTAIAGALDAAFPIGGDITDPRFRAPYSVSRQWTVQSAADVLINENANAQAYVTVIVTAVMASVLLVLLVACTNLANLVLARNAAREGELAIRQSLGASRWRLIREALVEHLLVSVAGGVAGLGLARLLLVSLGNGLAVNGRATLTVAPRLDLPVLMMCLGATMLALVVAGLVPSLRMLRRNARATFARQGVAGALPRWRGRRLLIASQVAVSMVLLAIAAVFVSEVRASLHLDVGLDVDRLAVAAVDFTEQHIDSTRVDEIVASVTAALGRRPDVAAVAVSSGLPIELRNPGGRVRDPAVSIEAAAPMPAGDGVGIASVEVLASTTEIFDTLGVSVLRGRGFDERDAAGAEPVVIVSHRTATSVFGTSDVVGRTVEFARSRWVGQEPQSPHLRTIVGVAADTDAGTAGSRSRGAIYLPLTQQAEGGLVFSVRAAGDPTELVGVLRAALLGAEPELAIERIGIGRDVILPPNALTQAAAGGATMLGGFALVLALAGLYGVLSHVVARRRREIGVRLALGATRAIILRDVIRDGLGPVVLGVMVGTAISVVARAGMRPLFQRLVPFGDPMVVLVVPALLMAAGLLACYVPARRAARVDPNIALRDG